MPCSGTRTTFWVTEIEQWKCGLGSRKLTGACLSSSDGDELLLDICQMLNKLLCNIGEGSELTTLCTVGADILSMGHNPRPSFVIRLCVSCRLPPSKDSEDAVLINKYCQLHIAGLQVCSSWQVTWLEEMVLSQIETWNPAVTLARLLCAAGQE